MVGDIFLDPCVLNDKAPGYVISGKDAQSDAEAARFLNPWSMESDRGIQWEASGLIVFTLAETCIQLPWWDAPLSSKDTGRVQRTSSSNIPHL